MTGVYSFKWQFLYILLISFCLIVLNWDVSMMLYWNCKREETWLVLDDTGNKVNISSLKRGCSLRCFFLISFIKSKKFPSLHSLLPLFVCPRNRLWNNDLNAIVYLGSNLKKHYKASAQWIRGEKKTNKRCLIKPVTIRNQGTTHSLELLRREMRELGILGWGLMGRERGANSLALLACLVGYRARERS